MATHTLSPTPTSLSTRRGALTLAAGAFASVGLTAGAAATVAATTAPSPDGELLQLCAEYVAFDIEYCRLGRDTYELPIHDPEADRVFALQVAMVPRKHKMVDRIADMPAHTPEGLKAKALAALHALSGDHDAGDGVSDPDDVLVWSICRDLCGRA